MAKRITLSNNKLDIIVPQLDTPLKNCAEVYPEFKQLKDAHGFLKRLDAIHRDETGLYPVPSHGAVSVRKATEIMAYYFKREFHYDFPGYQANEGTNGKDRIFLLARRPYHDGKEQYAVGAVVFRWRNYSNALSQFVLSWVWIHPFLRRQGIFTTCWKIFREVYGDFQVESPYSQAMHAFLTKNAYFQSSE